MKKFFTLLLIASSLVAHSQSTTVVISQVYGGGGGTTGTYQFDYIELFNRSSVVRDISGFSIMYGSASGQFGSSATAIYTFPASTTIAPGKYLLVQLGAAGTGGVVLPVTADLITTNIAMSGTSGKVALVTSAFTSNTCGATATPCTIPNANIIDIVSYGASNNAEGGVSVNNGVAITSTQGCVRKLAGCQDTDNNNADFDVVTAPVPRNGATPTNVCVLPVNFTGFKLAINGQSVIASWNTANEINVEKFNVERSADGRNFITVGTVAARNAIANSYSFSDGLQSGVTYYRIKSIDKDGSYKYTNTLTINGAKKGLSIEVYPNPAINNLMVSHEITKVGATAKIVSMEGKLIYSAPLQVGLTTSTLDISKLVKGNYMVIIENGNDKQTAKFVKQ